MTNLQNEQPEEPPTTLVDAETETTTEQEPAEVSYCIILGVEELA